LLIEFLMPRPETSGRVIALALALAAPRAASFTAGASFFAAGGKETGSAGGALSADGEMAAAALPRLRNAVTAVLLRLSGTEALWLFG